MNRKTSEQSGVVDDKTKIFAFRLSTDVCKRLMKRAKPKETKSQLIRRAVDAFLATDRS